MSHFARQYRARGHSGQGNHSLQKDSKTSIEIHNKKYSVTNAQQIANKQPVSYSSQLLISLQTELQPSRQRLPYTMIRGMALSKAKSRPIKDPMLAYAFCNVIAQAVIYTYI